MSATKKTHPAPTTAPAAKKALTLTKDTLRDLAATARQQRKVKGGSSAGAGGSKMGGGGTASIAM